VSLSERLPIHRVGTPRDALEELRNRLREADQVITAVFGRTQDDIGLVERGKRRFDIGGHQPRRIGSDDDHAPSPMLKRFACRMRQPLAQR
jgi:hypothetical protein